MYVPECDVRRLKERCYNYGEPATSISIIYIRGTFLGQEESV
jgi:hypothetical protein